MPEEFENQDSSEEIVVETESKVEAEEEKRVPLSELLELRAELKQAKEDGNYTRQQMARLMSDYQEALRQAKPKEQEISPDPEIAAAIRPYLKPIEERAIRAEERAERLERETLQAKAERLIEKELPNIKDIRGEILKEIQSYSDEEQQEILANPREVVRIGKMINRSKGIKDEAVSSSRSRAKGESGSTPTRLDADSSVDAKVAAWLKANASNL